MKYAVFGATGQTGIHVVKQGLDAGHLVTAFVRQHYLIHLICTEIKALNISGFILFNILVAYNFLFV